MPPAASTNVRSIAFAVSATEDMEGRALEDTKRRRKGVALRSGFAPAVKPVAEGTMRAAMIRERSAIRTASLLAAGAAADGAALQGGRCHGKQNRHRVLSRSGASAQGMARRRSIRARTALFS